jgi:hypothetical protein
MRRRMRLSVPEQGAYLRAVVGGQYPVLRRDHERPGHQPLPSGSGAVVAADFVALRPDPLVSCGAGCSGTSPGGFRPLASVTPTLSCA